MWTLFRVHQSDQNRAAWLKSLLLESFLHPSMAQTTQPLSLGEDLVQSEGSNISGLTKHEKDKPSKRPCIQYPWVSNGRSWNWTPPSTSLAPFLIMGLSTYHLTTAEVPASDHQPVTLTSWPLDMYGHSGIYSYHGWSHPDGTTYTTIMFGVSSCLHESLTEDYWFHTLDGDQIPSSGWSFSAPKTKLSGLLFQIQKSIRTSLHLLILPTTLPFRFRVTKLLIALVSVLILPCFILYACYISWYQRLTGGSYLLSYQWSLSQASRNPLVCLRGTWNIKPNPDGCSVHGGSATYICAPSDTDIGLFSSGPPDLESKRPESDKEDVLDLSGLHSYTSRSAFFHWWLQSILRNDKMHGRCLKIQWTTDMPKVTDPVNKLRKTDLPSSVVLPMLPVHLEALKEAWTKPALLAPMPKCYESYVQGRTVWCKIYLP